jgi:CubicO group peptidase (beta-lactamase class C family)
MVASFGVAQIHGSVAVGFERVAEVFANNFEQRGELGAACAVYREGRPVVDLWGGLAEPSTGRRWQHDTLVILFSTSKGVASVVVNQLIERGLLDVDEKVASYWPEFAAAGKADISLRWVLSHQAGLPDESDKLTLEDLLESERQVQALAARAPAWPPGSAHGYHARTFGWMLGELVRRVTGATLGQYLAAQIAGPLAVDLHIGLPEPLEPRVASLWKASPSAPGPPELVPYDEPWNTRALRAAELPSSNGLGSAHALARLYAACVGEVDGMRLLRPETVARACEVQATGLDCVLGAPFTFGLGFLLPPTLPSRVGPRAFGHGGNGGSCAFADPDRGIGFGYVPNRIRPPGESELCQYALVEAVYDSFEA